MIHEISIANLGVIASTTIEFHPGLTVLTGETGAGKTLITTAISQLLGAKPDTSLIRHGETDAVIDCTIGVPADPTLLSQLGDLAAAMDDDEIIVTKSIGARSRALIGGRPVAANMLAELVGSMVTLHGQHGQVRLTRPGEQRAALDRTAHGVAELLPVQADAWANLNMARNSLAAAVNSASSQGRELEELRAFVEDVDLVAPRSGEAASLDERILAVSSAEQVERSLRHALMLISESDGVESQDVASLLGQVKRLVEAHAEFPAFAAWQAEVVELQERVADLSHGIARYLDGLGDERDSLDSLMSRKAAISGLVRRWGGDLDTILERYAEASRQAALASDPEEQLRTLRSLVEHCEAEQEAVCAQLHDARVLAASELQTRVERELHELGLTHSKFDIQVSRQHSPTTSGDDHVEFQFTANPGIPLQSLASVGSGGELSRVMLALEASTATSSGHTFVFDEIDAGIGGKAGVIVGQRLAELALHNQVIVVTHLAQVAAFADRHVVVEKSTDGATTNTIARVLSAEARAGEIARMLSGSDDSAVAAAHAEELLENAERLRRVVS